MPGGKTRKKVDPVPAGLCRTRYEDDLAILDTYHKRRLFGLGIGALLLLPWVASLYVVDLANQVAIAVLVALGLNLLTGVAGQVSLGSAATMALGAYTTAILSGSFHLPVWVAVPASAAAGGLAGLLVGLPSLRLKGLYLAVATLGLHFVAVYLASEYQFRAGLNFGLFVAAPVIGPWTLSSTRSWYYVLFGFVVLAGTFVANLLRTAPGRAWMAIRDRDVAAASVGINVAAYKLRAFVVSSGLMALAGSLWAYYSRVVNVEAFGLELAIQHVAMIIVGGLGSVLGSILGGAVITLLPYGISALAARLGAGANSPDIYALNYMTFGLLMGAFLLLEPRGLVAIWERLRAYVLLWPFQYRPLAQRM